MSQRQADAIREWWANRKAAGWTPPHPAMSYEERKRRGREAAVRRYVVKRTEILERSKAAYVRNKVAIAAWRKTESVREKERADDRRRRADNGDAVRERDRAGYALNRERKLAQNTKWHAHNRERVRANARKRDALKAGTSVGPVDYERVLRESGGICGICRANVDILDPKVYHFDHKHPLARGGAHIQDNIQLAHAKCNMRKHARVAGTGQPATLGEGGGTVQ